MNIKSERFEMRLDQDSLAQIDAWAMRHATSRAEAVRDLIEAGLARLHQPAFSGGEKLIISMLCTLFQHLKMEDGVDAEFVSEVMSGGHYWALEWEYPGIYHPHVDKRGSVTDVVNAMDMWSFLESGHAALSPAGTAKVKQEAEPFGEHVRFPGFDGNNESEHLGIARLMIEHMDRFTSFKGRDLNSHCPMLDGYRRMYGVFEPIRIGLVGRQMSADEIIRVLRERTHPSYREA